MRKGEPGLTCLPAVGDYVESCLGSEHRKVGKENKLILEELIPQTGQRADWQPKATQPAWVREAEVLSLV